MPLPYHSLKITPLQPSPAAASDSPEGQILDTLADATAGLKPYVAPLASDPIVEWLAIGDPFTAAIGSNGIDDYDRHSWECERYLQSYPRKMDRDSRLPGNMADSKFTNGACSGKKLRDIPENQLSDNPAQGYVKFGKPQVVVMTIGGNDLGFTK